MAYFGNGNFGNFGHFLTMNSFQNPNYPPQQSMNQSAYSNSCNNQNYNQNFQSQDYFQDNSFQQESEDPKEFLKKHHINIIGEENSEPILNLENSPFDVDIIQTLRSQNIFKPTPIQSVCWPLALKGRDIVGIAQTGSGKTLAFILPALMYIKTKPSPGVGDGPICLVMCPTRELAQQVQQIADIFGKPLNITNACIYGGSTQKKQTMELKNSPHIVIATPGRLITLLESCETSLNLCSYLILDEADRMLDMGFEKQIRKIAEYLRPDRQTLMFSATWPQEVHSLAEEMLNDYVKVVIGNKELTANCNIVQLIEICQHWEKMGKLYNLIGSIAATNYTYKMLIFVRTKKKCNILNAMLIKRGWPVICIHGDKQQVDREKVLSDFKTGMVPILVATSVASRGLDVEDINYVINFDFPDTMEDYIHRIGRTARSSKKGTAFSYFTPRSYHLAAPFIDVLKNAGQLIHPKLYAIASKNQPFEQKRELAADRGLKGAKVFKSSINGEEDSDSDDSDVNESVGDTSHSNSQDGSTQQQQSAPNVSTVTGNKGPHQALPTPISMMPMGCGGDPIGNAIGNFIISKNSISSFMMPGTTNSKFNNQVLQQQPLSSVDIKNSVKVEGGTKQATADDQDISITSELAKANRLFEQMQQLAGNIKKEEDSTKAYDSIVTADNNIQRKLSTRWGEPPKVSHQSKPTKLQKLTPPDPQKLPILQKILADLIPHSSKTSGTSANINLFSPQARKLSPPKVIHILPPPIVPQQLTLTPGPTALNAPVPQPQHPTQTISSLLNDINKIGLPAFNAPSAKDQSPPSYKRRSKSPISSRDIGKSRRSGSKFDKYNSRRYHQSSPSRKYASHRRSNSKERTSGSHNSRFRENTKFRFRDRRDRSRNRGSGGRRASRSPHNRRRSRDSRSRSSDRASTHRGSSFHNPNPFGVVTTPNFSQRPDDTVQQQQHLLQANANISAQALGNQPQLVQAGPVVAPIPTMDAMSNLMSAFMSGQTNPGNAITNIGMGGQVAAATNPLANNPATAFMNNMMTMMMMAMGAGAAVSAVPLQSQQYQAPQQQQPIMSNQAQSSMLNNQASAPYGGNNPAFNQMMPTTTVNSNFGQNQHGTPAHPVQMGLNSNPNIGQGLEGMVNPAFGLGQGFNMQQDNGSSNNLSQQRSSLGSSYGKTSSNLNQVAPPQQVPADSNSSLNLNFADADRPNYRYKRFLNQMTGPGSGKYRNDEDSSSYKRDDSYDRRSSRGGEDDRRDRRRSRKDWR